MSRRVEKKVGIIHPELIESGGSEAAAVYIAEALRDKYNVSLITTSASNLEELNEYYGTNLGSDVEIIEHLLLKRFRVFDALRGSLLTRFCRSIADSFDLLISAYNVMDFGERGIQFIADFCFDDKLRGKLNPSPNGIKGYFYRDSLIRRIYLGLGRLISGASEEGFKKNLTVANSRWSAEVMKKECGIDCKVIYPPVIAEFPDISWEERKDGFVYLGRLIPKKGIDFIIEALDKVRRKGWDIHLHIIGPLENTEYVKHLKRLSAQKGDWVKMEGVKYKEEKREFLTSHRFGISARPKEPFGISVAEMVRAGCIVWVPDSGGQLEIVNHPDLVFTDIEDATNKIDRVLESSELQKSLRRHLRKQAEIFSVEVFKKEVKALVDDYFERNE